MSNHYDAEKASTDALIRAIADNHSGNVTEGEKIAKSVLVAIQYGDIPGLTTTEERDQFRRMHHNACQTLGAIQQALGCTVVGAEAEAVETLRAERDALAAHVERISDYKNHLEAKGLMPARMAGVIEESPATSLARRDAQVIASLQFPTILRKMWSGGEVQRWLEDQAEAKCHQAGRGDHA